MAKKHLLKQLGGSAASVLGMGGLFCLSAGLGADPVAAAGLAGMAGAAGNSLLQAVLAPAR